MQQVPALSRAIVFGFVWIFLFAAIFLTLDAFDLWQKLPAGLTGGVDLLTGFILFLALLAHLALATGEIPPKPSANAQR